jgi:hypothetical protein
MIYPAKKRIYSDKLKQYGWKPEVLNYYYANY